MAKRARKYYLGLTTITQDVADFSESEYGKPILSNSSLQLLLKQSPATISEVQRLFNLTQEEKYLLLEGEVGEGLFFAGTKHVAIKIVASYTEDQLITSDPRQLLEIEENPFDRTKLTKIELLEFNDQLSIKEKVSTFLKKKLMYEIYSNVCLNFIFFFISY
jgi:hypothetical protein